MNLHEHFEVIRTHEVSVGVVVGVKGAGSEGELGEGNDG